MPGGANVADLADLIGPSPEVAAVREEAEADVLS
jgi:hypothetical protein